MSEQKRRVPLGDDLEGAIPELRRPFAVHAVQFRILEGRDKKKVNCAGYITARTVIDRINHVCPHLWTGERYEPIPGGLRCDLTLGGATRSDVGWSAGTSTAMTLKTLYSDAFKRAAVKFGVGVSLYALPRLVLYVQNGHVRTYDRPARDITSGKGKTMYYLTDAGQEELRKRYQQWLDEHGIEAFGPVLEHGHVAGSADPEDEPEVLPEQQEILFDDGPTDLPPDVEAVVACATELKHAGLMNRDAARMATAGNGGREAWVDRGWEELRRAAVAWEREDVLAKHDPQKRDLSHDQAAAGDPAPTASGGSETPDTAGQTSDYAEPTAEEQAAADALGQTIISQGFLDEGPPRKAEPKQGKLS